VEKEFFWQTKWDVLEEIKNRFDKEGVEICFNQLDVHIKEK
jgi:small conductance mechanosensitive channel